MITELLREMLKEEWRMHSELFSGRSFAFFPVIIFTLSAVFSYMLNFADIGFGSVSNGIGFLGIFLGLSVGSIGFSSRDAVKNVLGPTSFLVYSSRTLPVKDLTLIAVFLFKDLVYYSFLFLLPLSLGFALYSVPVVISGGAMLLGGFILGLLSAVTAARLSLRIPGFSSSYRNRISPLADKTVLDTMRSSGGLLKIIFSLTVLTGFYWFMVLNFSFTRAFLTNPVLSFSALLGIVSLSVYNWINRFDSLEDYTYLPVEKNSLLAGKQKAFLAVSVPLITAFLGLTLIFYPVEPLIFALALLSSLAVQFYTLGLTSWLTGLKPNSRLFDSRIFAKYGVLTLLAVLPLLLLSIIYSPAITHYFLGFLALISLVGVMMAEKAREK